LVHAVSTSRAGGGKLAREEFRKNYASRKDVGGAYLQRGKRDPTIAFIGSFDTQRRKTVGKKGLKKEKRTSEGRKTLVLRENLGERVN